MEEGNKRLYYRGSKGELGVLQAPLAILENGNGYVRKQVLKLHLQHRDTPMPRGKTAFLILAVNNEGK